jgi:hypothetical protein
VVPKKKKIPQKEKMKIGGESMQKECWWKVFAPVCVGECFNDKPVILLLLFVFLFLFFFSTLEKWTARCCCARRPFSTDGELYWV